MNNSPASAAIMAASPDINITAASLRGSPSDRIIKPRPRKDSLHSISGNESVPGRVTKPRARKSPGSGAKRSEPAKRKFICSFSHYGCDVALSSKNEWKRHVSIQHLALGFYRCDVGPCNPEYNPGVPGHKRVYNDFNRKDLFTQHHRRMHKPESGPGSGVFAPGQEGSADWKAFEDTLENVRQRCWVEKRKPPQRSTCGFCGRVFEGEGSWNDRMEHVGGHFSRDVIDSKEEREDEDLTNWALQEGIIKDAGNGRHVLADQPPSTRMAHYLPTPELSPTDLSSQVPGQELPMNHNLIDPSISQAGPYQDPNAPFSPTNGMDPHSYAQMMQDPFALFADAVSGPLTLPFQPGGLGSPSDRRNYNVAPPPLGGLGEADKEDGSGDRLEDLIHQLTKPKEPLIQRRLNWKCDCQLNFAVNVDENDKALIEKLSNINIVCGKSQTSYLKSGKATKYTVIKCDELAKHIKDEAGIDIEQTGIAVDPIVPVALASMAAGPVETAAGEDGKAS